MSDSESTETRTREKLRARGIEVLSPTELLELVVGAAPRGETARRVAERLVRRHGLPGLARLSPTEWSAQPGLDPASAARLCAVFELGRRAYAAEAEERPCLSSPRRVFELVRELGRARKEHLVGLYLDAQNRLLHRETISIGSLNVTRSHPREILHPAVVHLAYAFILAHNHPSGCLEPSGEDVDFTRAVCRAAELMGIELYDHVIVTRRGFTSLRERGLL